MRKEKDKTHIHYGIHSVQQALGHAPQDILELWLSNSRKTTHELQTILDTARQHGISIQKIPSGSLDDLTGTHQHQGIAIRRRPPTVMYEDDLQAILEEQTDTPQLFLILDGVQDPHNLGACLRTADAVGANAVIVPKDNAVGLNATVSKVASGAADTVPFISVTNLARTMRGLQQANIWIIGTDEDADKEFYDIDLSGHVAIAMGAEGQGLRQNTRKHCDHMVRLPMRGNVESLNVSVAAGVMLYEVLRQRRL